MALDKPFIHSLTAEGTPDPVNFNDCFTFKKFDLPQQGKTASARFHLVFSRDENSSSPKEIVWKYKNQCDRNAEYTRVLDLISKPI